MPIDVSRFAPQATTPSFTAPPSNMNEVARKYFALTEATENLVLQLVDADGKPVVVRPAFSSQCPATLSAAPARLLLPLARLVISSGVGWGGYEPSVRLSSGESMNFWFAPYPVAAEADVPDTNGQGHVRAYDPSATDFLDVTDAVFTEMANRLRFPPNPVQSLLYSVPIGRGA